MLAICPRPPVLHPQSHRSWQRSCYKNNYKKSKNVYPTGISFKLGSRPTLCNTTVVSLFSTVIFHIKVT